MTMEPRREKETALLDRMLEGLRPWALRGDRGAITAMLQVLQRKSQIVGIKE